jgi:hypothetical protein
LFVTFGTDGREEIDEEGENVKGKDERDGPFEDGGDVVAFSLVADAKCDGQSNFDKDKEEFDPEGNAKDTMLAEVCK